MNSPFSEPREFPPMTILQFALNVTANSLLGAYPDILKDYSAPRFFGPPPRLVAALILSRTAELSALLDTYRSAIAQQDYELDQLEGLF